MIGQQADRARTLASLHIKGDPIILFNAWDAGSAKAVAAAGAKAIATGSWSVAAAAGYDDGERIPLDALAGIVERIAGIVDLPVTVDFESGYARGGPELEQNVRRILSAGAVGINFEDQRIGADAMYGVEEQQARIASVRRAADSAGVPLFVNARTDLFLRSDPARHAEHVDEAIARGAAYAVAGASGLFVPGLSDLKLIERVCRESTLPVNVMFLPDLPARADLAKVGVARISYGPRPYREMMAGLTEAARRAIG